MEYGADVALYQRYAACMKSYASAYDDRTAVRPSPVTSQAMPARGARFVHCFLRAACPGEPGSPGYTRPSGALGYTVLRIRC